MIKVGKAYALDKSLARQMGGIYKPISHRAISLRKQISGHFSVQSSSTSSGSRRLNRGSCHTPKFALHVPFTMIQSSRFNPKALLKQSQDPQPTDSNLKVNCNQSMIQIMIISQTSSIEVHNHHLIKD